MTSVDLQEQLTARFKTLNDFSGIKFITDKNVSYPNIAFTQPDDNRFFILSFMFNEPEAISNFDEAQDEITGIFQIDICTPLESGESESNNKFKWISKLFSRGTTFEDIEITKSPSKTVDYDSDYYRTTVRINWVARIDKE
jgi:hypothetical protein